MTVDNIIPKAGQVVAVRGDRGRTINAFVFRVFTNGEFRAIPEHHAMYRKAVDWMRTSEGVQELRKHQVEIEYMSRVYALSELREG